LNNIDKNKFLVPKTITMGQFIYIIRKRLQLNGETALFITINNQLMTSSKLIVNVYDDHHEKDGFLHVVYTNENTFG